MSRILVVILAVVVAFGAAAPSLAQPDTLEKIKSTGVLIIGTRTGSPPFAYVNKNNEWVGFSIDLVEQLVKPSVEKAAGRPQSEGAESERMGGRGRLLLGRAVRHGDAEGRRQVQGGRRRGPQDRLRVGQVIRALRQVV